MDSDASTVRLIDSSGTDLTAEGRKAQKKSIDLGNYHRVLAESGTHDCVKTVDGTDAAMDDMIARAMGKSSGKSSKSFQVDCHATAVPSRNATGLSVKLAAKKFAYQPILMW